MSEERPDGGYLHVKRLVVNERRKRWEFDERRTVGGRKVGKFEEAHRRAVGVGAGSKETSA